LIIIVSPVLLAQRQKVWLWCYINVCLFCVTQTPHLKYFTTWTKKYKVYR